MRAVLQRVSRADVRVGDDVVGAIGAGLVALVGVTHSDTEREAAALAGKIHRLRIFDTPDGERSAADLDKEILVVSQFTLYGDARKGRRPSWVAAAPGAQAEPLVDQVANELRAAGATVRTGRFGAHMQVTMVGDGPVTIVLEV